MKKAALFLILCSLCADIAIAQGTSPAKMSFAFTTLAIKALRLGVEYDGSPELDVPGTIVSLSDLVGAVQAAGDAARSPAELAATEMVRKFIVARVKNNYGREEECKSAWEAWQSAHPNASDEWTAQAKVSSRELVMDRPIMQQMRDKEDACSTPLNAMLRSEHFVKIVACSEVEVSVTADMEKH